MKTPTEPQAQHTAGPLYLGYGRNPDDGAFYLRAGRREVAILDTDNSLIDEANAERIAFCWNACLGIPDPVSAIPALVGALDEMLATHELREHIGENITPLQRKAMDQARAALAQVKGGKR